MPPIEQRRTLALWLMWCVALVLGLRMASHQARVVDQRANGFVAYYTSARLLTEGEDAVRFYDRPWFQSHIARFEPTVLEIFSANPPTMSVLLVPLSSLGYYEARAVWVAFSFSVVVATMAWLLTTLRVSGLWAPGFAAFVFVYHPLVSTLEHGQFYGVGLALLAVVFHGYRKGSDLAIGVPLGFLLVTKTALLMIWPLLVVKKRWRAMAWGVGVAAATIAASWPWIGAEAWTRYVREAVELTRNPLLAVTAYQTVFGFFHHLFGRGGDSIGAPVIALPALATALSTIVSVALLIVTTIAAQRFRASAVIFAAAVLVGLILTPVTGESHFTLSLLPIAVLVAEAQRRGARYALLVIAGALLIGADLPYRSTRLTDGLLATFAYPKLYGTLLLWALALWTATVHSRDSEANRSTQ
jgi:Glycosyltransferase family 87